MRADPSLQCAFTRFLRHRSGASALEFALVAPALIFLIVGVLQVSVALYKGSTVQFVSERTLRIAMLDNTVDATHLRQQIEAELARLGEDLTVEVAYQVDDSGAVPIGRITVGYSYPVMLPMMDTIQARFAVDSSVPLRQ